jgi:glycosyltransferase involved in cell wall biosynthesis
MRVKNEARWIVESLRSIISICDEVLLMDDHSEDGTPDLARQEGATVLPSPFVGLQEARDKNWLLGHISERKPSWVVMIDGDEVLFSGDDKVLLAETDRPGVVSLCPQIIYAWDRPDQIRVDGVYRRFTRPSLFRWRPGLEFRGRNGTGFHCKNVPHEYVGRGSPSAARLLHYGYMDRADRIRKFQWYNEQERQLGVDASEDGYRHVIQGDVPEVPATARLRHAGPLELRAL